MGFIGHGRTQIAYRARTSRPLLAQKPAQIDGSEIGDVPGSLPVADTVAGELVESQQGRARLLITARKAARSWPRRRRRDRRVSHERLCWRPSKAQASHATPVDVGVLAGAANSASTVAATSAPGGRSFASANPQRPTRALCVLLTLRREPTPGAHIEQPGQPGH